MLRNLTHSVHPVSATAREIWSRRTIGVNFDILLDGRGHLGRGPGMGRKPGPLDGREFSSTGRLKEARPAMKSERNDQFPHV